MTAADRLRAAVNDFTSRPPFLGCRHVVQHGAGAVLCIQHPAAGLLCASCSERHIKRHNEVEERTCDECRGEVDRLHPLMGATKLTGGPIRDSRGFHRLFDEKVLFLGVGTCGGCFDGTGRTVVDLEAAVRGSGWRP